jgi:hypothetical protein
MMIFQRFEHQYKICTLVRLNLIKQMSNVKVILL